LAFHTYAAPPTRNAARVLLTLHVLAVNKTQDFETKYASHFQLAKMLKLLVFTAMVLRMMKKL
jgi:hypothetical protein